MSPDDAVPRWRLSSVHHLGLTVADIERSIVFYRDVLGLTLVRRRPHVDSDYVAQQTGYDNVVLSVASFQIAEGSPTLELVQYVSHAGPPAAVSTNQSGSSHLCLLVSDLQSAFDELSARGVTFRSAPVRITTGPNSGGLVVYFADPDGYTLEMFQPPERG
jgi:catechol 2,3-dioxygenase-like lactoylglutathione lyase family enzyme